MRGSASPSLSLSVSLPTRLLSSLHPPPSRYSAMERLKCMVSSLSHFSHAVGLKDKDGLCSEGLIDQNNCASICLLKAEQATASQGLYFHRLLLSAFNVIDLACPVMLQDKHSGPEKKAYSKRHVKSSLS